VLIDDPANPSRAIVADPRPVVDPHEQLRKNINAYARLYADADIEQLIDRASGDCWYCAMETVDTIGGVDHLREHVRERYAMATLALNACAFVGYREPRAVVRYGRGDTVVRAVRRYLTAALVPEGAGARPLNENS
jgi:hypothetical protein